MLHTQKIGKNYIIRSLVACTLLLACFLSGYASCVSVVPSDYFAYSTNALAQNSLSTYKRSPNAVDVQSHKLFSGLRVTVEPQQDIDSYEEIAHFFGWNEAAVFELMTQLSVVCSLSSHCPRAPPAA